MENFLKVTIINNKGSGRNRLSAELLGWGLNDPSYKIISKGRKDLESEGSKDGNTGKERKKKTVVESVSWSSVGPASQSMAFPAQGHDEQPILNLQRQMQEEDSDLL